MIAARLVLDLLELIGLLRLPLVALRRENGGDWIRSSWFLICVIAGVLPTLAVILLVYLAIHFAG